MQLPFLPFDIPPVLILLVLVFIWIKYTWHQRENDLNEEDPRPKRKRRGPDMAFSAGRDAAQQNARFQQVFIPMEPQEEPALRAFYLQELGLTEMRAPNYPKDIDGFWAVSGARQIYLGTQPSFPFDPETLPSFPIANFEMTAERLSAAGYEVSRDDRIAYIPRLIVTDPAGTQIALIKA